MRLEKIRLMKPGFSTHLFLLFGAALAHGNANASKPRPGDLKVDPAYRIELFQADVEGARSLAHAPDGTVFVGTRGKKVYAIRGGKRITIATDLDTPNGIAFRDGSLYVGETKRILKYEGIEAALSKSPIAIPKPTIVFSGLPADGGHDWRYMRFAPDGSLFVSIGAPCNVCNREKDEPRFASIVRFAKLDGTPPEIYARGVRNSVGFDWNPKTKALWFTDNGRDWLGDNEPDDELNSAEIPRLHFGFPYCHAGHVTDSKFSGNRTCAEFVPPKEKLGPHVAALGMRFLDANTALIALHGSWNRSTPSGYRAMKYTLGPGNPKYEVFIDGFRSPSGTVIGRPVDIDVQPDGSILISDDHADAIYRVTRITKITSPGASR